MARETTNKLLAMVEDGMINASDVLLAALKYMSEDEVSDMARINCFINDDDEDDRRDEEDDWDYDRPYGAGWPDTD